MLLTLAHPNTARVHLPSDDKMLPQLPPEVVSHILSYLSWDVSPDPLTRHRFTDLIRCQLVSHEFAAIAKRPEVWDSVLEYWTQHSPVSLGLPPYEAAIRRAKIDKSVLAQVHLLHKAPFDRLPIISSITRIGIEALDVLKWLESCADDNPEWDGGAYESLGRDLGGCIGRREAFESWRRLLRLLPAYGRPVPTQDDDEWEEPELRLSFSTNEISTCFDADAERRAFVAFDYFSETSLIGGDSLSLLRNLRAFSPATAPATDIPRGELVRLVWEEMRGMGLLNISRWDNFFILSNLFDHSSRSSEGYDSEYDSEPDFDYIGDESPEDEAHMLSTKLVVLCALLRNLPAACDVQAWPGVVDSTAFVAVARRKTLVSSRELWGYITIKDGRWFESAAAMQRATRVYPYPIPTAIFLVGFASSVWSRAERTNDEEIRVAADFAMLAMTLALPGVADWIQYLGSILDREVLLDYDFLKRLYRDHRGVPGDESRFIREQLGERMVRRREEDACQLPISLTEGVSIGMTFYTLQGEACVIIDFIEGREDSCRAIQRDDEFIQYSAQSILKLRRDRGEVNEKDLNDMAQLSLEVGRRFCRIEGDRFIPQAWVLHRYPETHF
ncbi:hypothetical protein P7C70_g5773, partial [Phenoliferia sp. Uapishka_3]